MYCSHRTSVGMPASHSSAATASFSASSALLHGFATTTVLVGSTSLSASNVGRLKNRWLAPRLLLLLSAKRRAITSTANVIPTSPVSPCT